MAYRYRATFLALTRDARLGQVLLELEDLETGLRWTRWIASWSKLLHVLCEELPGLQARITSDASLLVESSGWSSYLCDHRRGDDGGFDNFLLDPFALSESFLLWTEDALPPPGSLPGPRLAPGAHRKE